MCDNGYSGNDCNKLCSDSPGYCDLTTTYCTRNGTCLCKDGLKPANGNYPTNSCDCPFPSIQYGPACTNCSLCSTLIPSSICNSTYWGNGSCYCQSPQYIMNSNQTACICPLGKYGSTCTGTCPSNCPQFSTCSDGLNGTGQCVCQSPNFYFNTTTQTCECSDGYYGWNCSSICPNCSLLLNSSICSQGKNGNGSCICNESNCFNSTIYCDQNFNGTGDCICNKLNFKWNNKTKQCDDCLDGYYGENCTELCPNCSLIFDIDSYCNSGINGNGDCTCPNSNYITTPDGCECLPGHYGPGCTSLCPNCNSTFDVHSICVDGRNGTGTCDCQSPWFININNTCQCSPGYWGPTCTNQCQICNDPNAICDDGLQGTGKCYCSLPYIEYYNNITNTMYCDCPFGKYGINCSLNSIPCIDDERSHMTYGINATGRCECNNPPFIDWNNLIDQNNNNNNISNKIQPKCECPPNYWGLNCSNLCPDCINTFDINSYCRSGYFGDGQCICNDNFIYDKTQQKCICPPQIYGLKCTEQCNLTMPCEEQIKNSHCNDALLGDGTCQCDNGLIYNETINECQCPYLTYGYHCQFNCPINCPLYSHCDDGRYGTGECVSDDPLKYIKYLIYDSNLNMTIEKFDCYPNYYGENCNYLCASCESYDKNMQCNDGINGNGLCFCKLPYIWQNNPKSKYLCDCPLDRWGLDCSQLLPICGKNAIVDSGIDSNGQCYCLSGYIPINNNNNNILSCQLYINLTNQTITDLPSTYDINNFPCLSSPLYVKYNNQTKLCECNISNNYGVNCSETCQLCTGSHTICDSGHELASGECICSKPFIPVNNNNNNYCICPPNTYGNLCQYQCKTNEYCQLNYNGISNCGEFGNGECICQEPYVWNNELKQCDCPSGLSGIDCNIKCPTCIDTLQKCNSSRFINNPKCECIYPYQWNGEYCDCPYDKYGQNCEKTIYQYNCPLYSTINNGINGNGLCQCNYNLKPIYDTTNNKYLIKCDCPIDSVNYYGLNGCQNACPKCEPPSYCSSGINGNGQCLCPQGYKLNEITQNTCDLIQCPLGTYGSNCNQTCNCPNNFICDNELDILSTGQCYYNPCSNNGNYSIYFNNCSCPLQWYGESCTIPVCMYGLLDFSNEQHCLCQENYTGQFCDYNIIEQKTIEWNINFTIQAIDLYNKVKQLTLLNIIKFNTNNTIILNNLNKTESLYLNQTLASLLKDTINNIYNSMSTGQTVAAAGVSVATVIGIVATIKNLGTTITNPTIASSVSATSQFLQLITRGQLNTQQQHQQQKNILSSSLNKENTKLLMQQKIPKKRFVFHHQK